MGAPHGDPYSVSPLGCYLHSYHLLLAGYSSFYTRLFYPPDANYEKRKVISERAKVDAFSPSDDFLISALVEVSTDCTGEKQFRTIETWFQLLTWFYEFFIVVCGVVFCFD